MFTILSNKKPIKQLNYEKICAYELYPLISYLKKIIIFPFDKMVSMWLSYIKLSLLRIFSFTIINDDGTENLSLKKKIIENTLKMETSKHENSLIANMYGNVYIDDYHYKSVRINENVFISTYSSILDDFVSEVKNLIMSNVKSLEFDIDKIILSLLDDIRHKEQPKDLAVLNYR